MKTATDSTIIEGGMVTVGQGDPPIANGTVIVEDGRITYAGAATGAPDAPADAQKIDASGTTVMPGLVEAHWHATYFNILVLEDLDIAHPPETVAIHAAFNAKVALECGYTAARRRRLWILKLSPLSGDDVF